MKKLSLLLTIILFTISGYSQNQSLQNLQPNEKSVVKGEDGKIYAYDEWKLMWFSGKYSVKSSNTNDNKGKPEFLLYKLTTEQTQAMLASMPKPKESLAFPAGKKFDGFKVTDLNGNQFNLEEAKGKIIVLNFWFINCPPCKIEIPFLNEMIDSYKNTKDIIFLAIALDDSVRLQEFLKNNPYKYSIIENGRLISNQYSINSYPTHVVIDKGGKVKFSTYGLAANTVLWIKKSIDESLSTK